MTFRDRPSINRPLHKNDQIISGKRFGLTYEAPHCGSYGIKVTDENGNVTELPAILGRCEVDGEILYIHRSHRGTPFFSTKKDVLSGLAWSKQGDISSRYLWEDKSPESAVWHEVADQSPMIAVSPRITESYPPAFFSHLDVSVDDEYSAKKCWSFLAERLTPEARLIVGLFLVSPWSDEVGADPSVISIYGGGGNGMTMFARVITSLYGDSQEDPYISDDTLPTLRWYVERLSYIPLIVDYVGVVQKRPKQRFSRLIESSNHTDPKFRTNWHSNILAINYKPMKLDDELHYKRLLELHVQKVWKDVPNKEAWQGRSDWWRSIVDMLPNLSGHPWRSLLEEYEPGTSSAHRMTSEILESPSPESGDGNMRKLSQMAHRGSEWLAQWSDCDLWKPSERAWQNLRSDTARNY